MKISQTLTFFFVTGGFFRVTDAIDPCLPGNYAVLFKSGRRGNICEEGNTDGICDRDILTGWYKVQHEDDPKPRKMVDSAVDMYFCGTTYPIWLNGSHPRKIDGVVQRTACSSGLKSYCDFKYNISVKQCSTDDFVYYLGETNTCNEAYCFGQNRPCAKPNPCEEDNRIYLQISDDRSTNCHKDSMMLCDNSMYNWIRPVKNGKDVAMPNTCVKTKSCGTQYPIWLDGTIPTIKQKVVDRKACVNRDDNCQCTKFYNIQIRNCSSFLVYNLSSTSDCPERYCFGEEGNCLNPQDLENIHEQTYLYGILAAILLASVIFSIGCYFWYKRSRRLKRVASKSNMSSKEKEYDKPSIQKKTAP